MFRTVILDPELTVTQPDDVTAVSGIDAVSHALESFVTTRRTPASDLFAREAWRCLSRDFPKVLQHPRDLDARSGMLLGAHYAGAAIEQSMLGAAHACANPLTARYGTTHGVAIGVMLPHVLRWNTEDVDDRYREAADAAGINVRGGTAGDRLAAWVDEMIAKARMPRSLHDLGVRVDDLSGLAEDAAGQWTGTFNPRPFDRAAALTLYRAASANGP
jgi:alcohol dehydrogenase